MSQQRYYNQVQIKKYFCECGVFWNNWLRPWNYLFINTFQLKLVSFKKHSTDLEKNYLNGFSMMRVFTERGTDLYFV